MPGRICFFLVILCGSVAFSGRAQECVSPPSGMVSWWPGDGNATDIQGGNNGTLENGAAFAPGKVADAFSFDGVNQYIQVGDRTNLRMVDTTTIDAWIYPKGNGSAGSEGGIIVNKEGEYEVARFANGTIQWAFANSNPGWDWHDTGFVAPLNTWTHIAVAYDNGVVHTYANGALVDTFNGAGSIGDIDSRNDFRIGGRQSFDQYFEGLIDEVTIYNHVLTAAEIEAIYNAGSAGKCKCADLTCPANITQSNDPNLCGAVVSYLDPIGTGCGTFTCSPPSGSTFPVGTTTVTCISSTGPGCSFTVTVNDTQAPTITCPANIVVGNDPNQCGAAVNYPAPAVADNCANSGTPVCTPATGAAFPIGTTTVNCTVSDASGNTANCSFTVTVNDTIDPVLTCPSNITVSSDPGVCTAVVNYPAPAVMDNCAGQITPVCTPASGSTFPMGTTTVNCTATDPGGNMATCSFTITVNDTENPTITCPSNVAQGNDPNQCQAVVNYSNATATDNCANVGTPVCAPASGTAFPKGTTTVNCTVSDASGNQANCSFTVTVNDTQPPAITCPPNQTVQAAQGACSAVVNFNVTATDNCTGVGTPVCTPPSGATFPVGTTTVNCMVSDAAGNSSSCSFSVTVQDTQNPSITCPNNISVTTANQCEVVNYPAPTTTDNCPLPPNAVVCNPPSGFCFPVGPGNTPGVTTVTCTVTDASGNQASCSFTVTVRPCAITCPANITRVSDPGQCGAIVNYPAPTTQGGCGTVTCTPPSGSSFPKGTTTVTCTTQTGPSCSFTVTVNDTQAPTITCPSNIVQFNATNQCSAAVAYTNPIVTDNCPGVGMPACNPASGSIFPVGTTTVNCAVSDASGNTTACSFTVTVTDTQNPSIACPANIIVSTPNQCGVVNYPAPTASDNCPLPPNAVVCSPPSGFCFPIGTTTVTCVVTDASGNKASCTFTVETCAGFVSCPANITRNNDPNRCGAVVNYPAPPTGGNCGTVSCSPASGSFFPKGTTTVTCTNQDGRSCSFTITVNDAQLPSIICPPNVTTVIGNQCPPANNKVVNYPAPAVSDNCGNGSANLTVTCTPPSGAVFPLGTTTVNCTAKDAANNMKACSFTVTVFSTCLQDDSNPATKVLINLQTGAYQFLCNGVAHTGTGTVTASGCAFQIDHNTSSRRLRVTLDLNIKRGNGSLQSPPGTTICTIVDTNMNNNTCN